jgi:hypothetical protein
MLLPMLSSFDCLRLDLLSRTTSKANSVDCP